MDLVGNAAAVPDGLYGGAALLTAVVQVCLG